MQQRPSARTIRTNLSTITWSADRSGVTKSVDLDATEKAFGPRAVILGHHLRRPTSAMQYSYELRINQLLVRHRPPVLAPRLIGHDRRRASLTFEAVDAEPVGPKYPLELSEADLDGLVALATATGGYQHRQRWLRRLPIRSRLWRARQLSLLTESEHRALCDVVARTPIRWVFAHGDITPRNVLAGPEGMVLIDWEWAGVYPEGYELAFVWYVLVDLPAARQAVEHRLASSDTDPATFWLSALLIQLLHLEWIPDEFRSRHLQASEMLVARLLDSHLPSRSAGQKA